jgi:hypothetical protein
MTTLQDIKSYLDTIHSDDPKALGEALQGILESCWFYKHKLDKPFVDEPVKLNIENILATEEKKDII